MDASLSTFLQALEPRILDLDDGTLAAFVRAAILSLPDDALGDIIKSLEHTGPSASALGTVLSKLFDLPTQEPGPLMKRVLIMFKDSDIASALRNCIAATIPNTLCNKAAGTNVFPYTPSKEFLQLFALVGKLKHCVDSPDVRDHCFITGGFLTRCHVGKLQGIYDIDVYCMNGSHNNLIDAIKRTYDCICVTRKNVTTVFVRNSPTQIQVIATASASIAEEFLTFDLVCCKLAYYKGQFVTSEDFMEMLESPTGMSFELNGRAESYRIAKYSHLGFVIDTSKGVVSNSVSAESAANKHYMWTNETPERLLYLVKALFHPEYELTTLPLPMPVNGECAYKVTGTFGSEGTISSRAESKGDEIEVIFINSSRAPKLHIKTTISIHPDGYLLLPLDSMKDLEQLNARSFEAHYKDYCANHRIDVTYSKTVKLHKSIKMSDTFKQISDGKTHKCNLVLRSEVVHIPQHKRLAGRFVCESMTLCEQ